MSASWRTSRPGDWDAMAEILADDFSNDDRRRVVSAGIRHGRDAEIANMRAIAELWIHERNADRHRDPREAPCPRAYSLLASATKGSRRSLPSCSSSSRSTPTSGSSAIVTFDLDDFDAAIAELDARYLAGEAAAHAHTWSVIAGAYAALNRRELPATTPDWSTSTTGEGHRSRPVTMTAVPPRRSGTSTHGPQASTSRRCIG